MFERLTANLQFQGEALALRADRQRVLASNIANADTPNYQARDFEFSNALRQAVGSMGGPVGPDGSLRTQGPGQPGGAAMPGPGGLLAAAGSRATLSLVSNAPAAPGHLALRSLGSQASGVGGGAELLWRAPEQPSIDGNTVDLDRERANFADNSLRYEATLRFINGNVRTALSAIRGE